MICQTGSMDEARAAEVMAESAAVLRKAGARFAYLHGSRASGQYRPDSDIDTAVLRQEAGASRERRRDPIWLRGEHGVLTPELAVSMRKAVGFRNVLVHDYIEVDDSIVVDKLKSLGDLEEFVRQVAVYVTGAQPEPDLGGPPPHNGCVR